MSDSIASVRLCYAESILWKMTEIAMPATSAIDEQLIDGPGFVLVPNLMDPSEAAQARSGALELAASPSPAFGKLTDKIGDQHIRGLAAHGEIFERHAHQPALLE